MKDSPFNTRAFVVGVNEEWPKDRSRIGDVALYEAFRRRAKLDDSDEDTAATFVQDKQATALHTQQELEDFLRNAKTQQYSDEKIRFFFYFGGHGLEGRFCMHGDSKWYHKQVVETIEEFLGEGDEVWLLLDCCFSGGFYKAISDDASCRSRNRPAYVCIMSTEPDAGAGPDWTLTQCWLQAMSGDVDMDQSTDLTTSQVLAYMSEQIARVKQDLLTVYVKGVDCESRPFPFAASINEKTESTSLREATGNNAMARRKQHASRDTTNYPPCAIGDSLFAKWRGGHPAEDAPYELPLWFRASVIALPNANTSMYVEFWDPITSHRWRDHVSVKNVLDGVDGFNYWHYCYTPSEITVVHCALAKHLGYLDYSLPTGTNIVAAYRWNGEYYRATIVSDRSFPWKVLLDEQSLLLSAGPHVPLRWHRSRKYSIVPLGRCRISKRDGDAGVALTSEYSACPSSPHPVESASVVPTAPNGDILTTEQASPSSPQPVKSKNVVSTVPNVTPEPVARPLPRQAGSATSTTPDLALMNSFHSCGKVLRCAKKLFGSSELCCFWADSHEWFAARPATLEDGEQDLISTHVYYKEKGEYCIIQWEVDDTVSCLPKRFIRRRDLQNRTA